MSKQKNYWLKTLNIRPNEWWLVKKLFLLQFLQGAGIAFFFTASFSLFLHEVGITKLPYVLIFSAFLLWATGFIYSRIEHRYDTGKLTLIVTVFITVSMLFFRSVSAVTEGHWFLYIMFSWFNVLYLLNNLQFWGLASLLFDVRQSKRLFSVVSAGDIPAKFIGYTLALLTVDTIGTINLLWAAAACMLASVPFLISIKKSGYLQDHKHPDKHVVKKSTVRKVSTMAKNFTDNLLIRRLAALTIVISGCFIIVNYAFYAGVKEAFKDDVSLTQFIAFFGAFTRIIALVVKIIFTGRLINRLGIIRSLLITPIVMLIMIAAVLMAQRMEGNTRLIFYLFGATLTAIEILRSAINNPVFITLMQPLPTHERLRAHNIVKGIMDPFASLFTGILLLVLLKYQPHADLTNIYYILFGLGIIWVAGIYRVNSQYLKAIIKTISSNYFNRQDFKINDADTLKWLKEKVKTGSETEVINILKILDAGKNNRLDEVVLTALQHPSEKIKTAALHLIRQKKIPAQANLLLQVLNENESAGVKAAAIQTLCKTGIDSTLILPYLHDKNGEVIKAATAGLIKYGEGEVKSAAEKNLDQLIQSVNNKERIIAAAILGELDAGENYKRLQQMLPEDNKEVRKEVLLAAGKSANPVLLQQVMEKITTDEKTVLQSLLLSGETALPVIKTAVYNNFTTQQQKEKLIFLTGRIGGGKAQDMLLEMLNSRHQSYKAVARALYRSRYTAVKSLSKTALENKVLDLLAHSAGIIYMQNRLKEQAEKYQVLTGSLQIELTDMRDAVLNIFAVLYNRDQINKVRAAYLYGKKVNIFNAMEIIEMIARKDLADHFNAIYEPGDIANRMTELYKMYPAQFFEKTEQVLIRILSEDKYAYHYWTLACCLYTSKQQQLSIGSLLIDKFADAENVLLRETAGYVKLSL
jgi:ATP:ADP antiporter, AAA family